MTPVRAAGLPAFVCALVAALVVVPTAAIAPTTAIALAAGAPVLGALLFAFRACRRGGALARRAVLLASAALTFWATACAIRGAWAFWTAAGHG